MFYTQSVVSSPHFIPSMCFIPSPQFAVYVLYWPEKLCVRKKRIYYTNTNEFIRGAFTKNPDIFSSCMKISCYLHTWKDCYCHGYILKIAPFTVSKMVWYFVSVYINNKQNINGHLATLIKTTKIEKWKNRTLND